MTASFRYYAPRSLDEALMLLGEYGSDARLLAGGTDLLIKLRDGRERTVKHVINIKRIGGLNRLEIDARGLHLGPLVTASDLLNSPLVREQYPVLAEAAASMAAVQIRNLATVAGNLCNASPAADLAPPLLALDAQVLIAGCYGGRRVPLSEFFQGPGMTVLSQSEMICEILVPLQSSVQRAAFIKLSPRGAMDIAVASVAVSFHAANGKCDDVRIYMGAVGPTPLRAAQAEHALRGNDANAQVIHEAAQIAAEEARPIDDVRGSAWYRKAVIETLTRRALERLTNGK